MAEGACTGGRRAMRKSRLHDRFFMAFEAGTLLVRKLQHTPSRSTMRVVTA